MADDLYAVLELHRGASEQDLRAAYRRLAKACHPDVCPQDPLAEARFRRLTDAYTALLTELQAAASPSSRPPPHSAPPSPQRSTEPFAEDNGDDGDLLHRGFPDEDDLSDLFREIFQPAARPTPPPHRGQDSLRGRDMRYSLRLSFEEAALGGRKKVPLTSGQDVMVTVPPASENGTVLRLVGHGLPGRLGGRAGDALVELLVEPHPRYRRQGLDLLGELPVTLPEAILGGRITLTVLQKPVSIILPAAMNNGHQLRVKGFGLGAGTARGDLLLTVRVVLPRTIDPQLKSFILDWSQRHPYPIPDR